MASKPKSERPSKDADSDRLEAPRTRPEPFRTMRSVGMTSEMRKADFSARLKAAMKAKGWYPRELERRSGVARQNISTYINKRSLPTSDMLSKMAFALGVSEDELLPPTTGHEIQVTTSAFSVEEDPGSPNIVLLRVNKWVSRPTANAVVKALANDDASTDRD